MPPWEQAPALPVARPASSGETENPPDAAGGYRWALLAGIWFVYFCFGLIAASMAPLIPAITRELGISNVAMGAILGAWPLVYIASAVPCGVLLDRVAPRTSLTLGCAVIALSCLMRAFSHSQEAMFVSVGLFGIGGPLISVGAPKLAALLFAGSRRAVAMGVYSTGPALGTAAALALTSSVMMPLFDGEWRSVLFVYGAIAACAGAAWFVIASPRRAWPETGGSGGTPRFTLDAVHDILRLPAVQIVLLMAIGVFFVNHAMNNWLPEMLRSKGWNAAQAGYLAALPTTVGIAGSLIVPRFAVGDRRVLVVALLFLSMLTSAILLLAAHDWTLILPLVLFGITRTSTPALVILLLMETRGVRADRHGLVGGMYFVAGEIGGALGPLTVGVVSEATGGFNASFALIAAVSAVLILLCLAYVKANAGLRPQG